MIVQNINHIITRSNKHGLFFIKSLNKPFADLIGQFVAVHHPNMVVLSLPGEQLAIPVGLTGIDAQTSPLPRLPVPRSELLHKINLLTHGVAHAGGVGDPRILAAGVHDRALQLNLTARRVENEREGAVKNIRLDP